MKQNEVIPIEKLPFKQFELLGLEKKDVLDLPPSTMKTLLAGNRTSLIQFKNLRLNEISEPVTLNAKLSLQKDGDSYKLMMHPVNLEQKNTLDLNPKEIEFLQKDPLNILPKKVVDKDGTLTDSFISLDRVTNEFVAVKKDTLKSPESINDIVLSNTQKKDFVNGKPIQIGKDNYQMDINSEQGIAGKNLDKIEFKSGKYDSYNLILDVALFASGLAPLILIEHLAKMLFNNRENIHDLLKVDLKPAIDRTISSIAEKFENGSELNNRQKNELFVVNVKDSINSKEDIKLAPANIKNNLEPFSKAEIIPNYTFTGTLVEHGKAPFEFKQDNKENYFVKLDTTVGEKVVWGQDLSRAIEASNTKVGDRVGINYEGAQPLKVNIDVKDHQGEVIGVKEKTVNRNTWDVRNLSEGAKNEIGNKIQEPSIKAENKTEIEQPKKEVKPNEAVPEQPKAHVTQGGKIDQIKTEIVAEVKTQNKAAEITTKDDNKIHHPEQKQAGETNATLKSDMNTQTGNIATGAAVITKDVKEIQEVKKGGMKR